MDTSSATNLSVSDGVFEVSGRLVEVTHILSFRAESAGSSPRAPCRIFTVVPALVSACVSLSVAALPALSMSGKITGLRAAVCLIREWWRISLAKVVREAMTAPGSRW